MKNYLMSILTTDHRSLAVFRMGLGIIATLDGAFRLCDLTAHYSDAGVVSINQAMTVAQHHGTGVWSLAFFSGSPQWSAFLLITLMFCGIFLAVGRLTRIMTLICWILVVSIHHRNPFVLNGGDILFGLLLFWSLWLPLGAVWSLDDKKNRGSTPQGTAPATPIIFQLCVLYWFSALFKSHPIWRVEESAVDHIAHLGSYTFGWAEFLWDKPELSRWLTRSTLWLEEAGPALLLVPFWRGPIRTLLVATFAGFHLIGIAGLMNIGLFPSICTVAWLAMLPTEFWNWLNPSPQLTKDHHITKQTIPSIPVSWGNSLMSKCMLCMTMLLVLFNNIVSLNSVKLGWLMPRPLKVATNALHLNQRWRLFANRPMTRDGWFIAEAYFVNGQVGDLLQHGSPVVWDRPKNLREHFSNTRWRKLWLNSFHHRLPFLVNGLHDYLKTEWNMIHPDHQIRDLKIYFILEDYLYPEDNGQRITLFPVVGLSANGKAIFEGDLRRNEELKLYEELQQPE